MNVALTRENDPKPLGEKGLRPCCAPWLISRPCGKQSFPRSCAGCPRSLSLIPIMLFFTFAQKYLIRGIATTGLK